MTPSPESMTVPVSDLSVTWRDAQDAAKDNTACTAIYNPGTLNDSNMISAKVNHSDLFKANILRQLILREYMLVCNINWYKYNISSSYATIIAKNYKYQIIIFQ